MSSKKKPENYELTLYPKSQDITKSWYVELFYTDPVTRESCRKQYRNNINYIKSKTERLKEANSLKKALEIKLSTGWNPITNSIPLVDSGTTLPDVPFNQALTFALDSKKMTLAPKSYTDIRGVMAFAQQAAIKARIHLQPISEIKRNHIKILLEQISKDRQAAYDKEGKGKKWTGNSYNKYRQFLQILFTELEEYEAIEFNPCTKINDKPEISTNLHRHPSDQEAEIIKAELKKVNFDFYVYLATESLTGIRPKELFGLQVCDIDWLNQCFDIQATDGKSKSRKARKVPIPNALMQYIEHLQLERANPDDFIFSRGFRPGVERMHRDVATKLWKTIIKDGLGIKVSLYSFKGYGGEKKRMAGVAAGSVSSGFGHGNMGMTMRYLHGEQDRINKEIIEKTPEF